MDATEITAAAAAHGVAPAPFVNLRDPARRLGPDGKPAVSRRAPIWEDVPDAKWNDWRWQLSNRVNDLAEIERILNLTDDAREGLSAPDVREKLALLASNTVTKFAPALATDFLVDVRRFANAAIAENAKRETMYAQTTMP